MSRIIRPVVALIAALALWEAAVWYNDVPYYLVPGPTSILTTLGWP